MASLRFAARTQMELDLEQAKGCVLGRTPCITYDGANDAPPSTVSPTHGDAAGIDELDSVKTDGTHIHTIVGNDLVVLASWPASATAVAARVTLPAGEQRGLYLMGTNVVAVTGVDSPDVAQRRQAAAAHGGWELRAHDAAIVSVIDVSSPLAPVVTSRQGVDGSLVASRNVDGHAYLALGSQVAIPGLALSPGDLPMGASPSEVEEAFDALHARNLSAIDAVSLDAWLPHRYAVGTDGALGERGAPITACADVYGTALHSGSGLLTIAPVDAANGVTTGAVTVAGDWGYAYASRDAFYVASTDWGYGWYLADRGEAPAIATQLHKFALTDSGARWFPERNLFVAPVSAHEYEPGFKGYRTELFAYRVTPSAATPLGSLSHADLLDAMVGGPACTPEGAGDVAHISRSVVIDEFVYSLSPIGLAVHDTRALASGALAEVQLAEEASAALWARAIRCPDAEPDAPRDGSR